MLLKQSPAWVWPQAGWQQRPREPWGSALPGFRVNHALATSVAFTSGSHRHQQRQWQPEGGGEGASGGAHALTVTRGAEAGSFRVEGGALGDAPALVAAARLGEDSLEADVDGQRILASWCLHT